MNAKKVGKTIAWLRKKNGMTQSMLAQQLNISNKTVSKWESGQGYPDISVFPILASIFNVSIEYLMLGERKGIAVAGSIVVDMVKTIDCYPEIGMLAYVTDVTRSVGGCVPNTAIDLAKIDHLLPVSAVGRVGADENGRYVVGELHKYGISTERIFVSDEISTSFCDVMSLPTGERTFFCRKGANALFSPEDVDIEHLNCDMLHVGYLLLMDKFDRKDAVYGTVMARFLHDVQQREIKTSIDVVSDSTAHYEEIIPALKYCNYVILNEIECCNIWKMSARKSDGTLDTEHLCRAMRKMADAGVKDKVIIHSKEAGFVLDVKTDQITASASLKLPDEEIQGSVGAGDAFCAGCLYALYQNYSDVNLLEFAAGAAACSLSAANSVDGMKHKTEILKLIKRYKKNDGVEKCL